MIETQSAQIAQISAKDSRLFQKTHLQNQNWRNDWREPNPFKNSKRARSKRPPRDAHVRTQHIARIASLGTACTRSARLQPERGGAARAHSGTMADADLALRLLHAEGEAAALRKAAALSARRLEKAGARATRLEGLLGETERETEVLRARLREAEAGAAAGTHGRADAEAEAVSAAASAAVVVAEERVCSLEASLAGLREGLCEKESVLEAVRADLEAARGEVCRLEGVNVALGADVERLEGEMAALKRVLGEKERIVRGLQNDKLEVVKVLEGLDSERDELACELEGMQKAAKDAVLQVQSDAADEIAQLATAADELRQVVENMELEKCSLLARIAHFQEQLAESGREKEAVKLAADTANAANVEHENAIGLLKSTIVQLDMQCSVLHDAQNSAAKAESNLCADVKHLSERLREKENAGQSLVRQKDEVMSKVQALDRENSMLRAALIESDQILAKANTEGQRVADASRLTTGNAERRLEAVHDQLSELQEAELAARAALQTMLDHLESAIPSFSSQQGADGVSKVEAGETRASVDDLISRGNAAVSVVEQLVQGAATTEQVADRLKSRMADVTSAKESLEVANKDLADRLRQMSEEDTDLVQRLVERETIATKLLYGYKNAAEANAEKLHQQEKAAELNLIMMQREQASLESELENSKTRFNDVLVQVEEAAKVLADALEEKDALEHKLKDVEAEHARATEASAAQLQELQESADGLSESLQSMESLRSNEAAASQQLMEEALAQVDNLKEQVEALEAERDRALQGLKNMTCQVEIHVAGSDALTEELTKARETMEEQNVKVQKLAAELQNAQNSASDACARVERAEEQAQVLANKLKDTTLNSDVAAQELAKKMDDKVTELQVAHAEAMSRTEGEFKERYETAKQQSDTMRLDLEQKNAAMSEELATLRDRSSHASSEYSDRIAHAEESAKELRVHLETAISAAEALEKDRTQILQAQNEEKEQRGALVCDLQAATEELERIRTVEAKMKEKLEYAEAAIAALELKLNDSQQQAALQVAENSAQLEQILADLETKTSELSETREHAALCDLEKNKLKSELERLQNHVVLDLKESRDSAKQEVVRLEALVQAKAEEVSQLEETVVAENEELNRKLRDAASKIERAGDSLAAKDRAIGELNRELASSREEANEVAETLRQRDTSGGNIRAKVMELETTVESLTDDIAQAKSRLTAKSSEFNQAQESIVELKDRYANLELERDSLAKGSKPERSDEESNALQEEAAMALEKYATVLDKNRRMQKKVKRLEILLNAEKRKSALTKAPADAGAAKRQVSPSTKGLSPTMKRARDLERRTPLTPIPTNARPPLAPRSAQPRGNLNF